MYCPSFYLTKVLVLKSILADIGIATPAFFPFYVHEIFFPSLYFQSVCIFPIDVSLLEATHIQVLVSYPVSYPMFLVSTFKPFTFKVIIDGCAFIAILFFNYFPLFFSFSSSSS